MTDHRLEESWTWFGVATAVVLLRYTSRWIRLGGLQFFELEDFVMVPAYCFYTNLIVWVNIQEHHPVTNILPPSGTAGMSNAQIQDRIYGSKVTFVIEESMIMVQFLSKLCMCLLYFKLTNGLTRQIWVKILLGYVILGWFITELFYFAIWCRPFMDYFRVFDNNNIQCETAQHHLIMSYTFNISSDLFMLAVPVPLLIQAQLPWKRKMVLLGVFSFGIFVIIAATMSRYYCFAKPDSILWIFWYVREASTVIIVANIPHLYPVLRALFDLPAFGSLVRRSRRADPRYPQYPLGSVERNNPRRGDFQRTESTEDIAPRGGGGGGGTALRIWQRKEFNVRSAHAGDTPWQDIEAVNVIPESLGSKSALMSSVTETSKGSD